MQPAPLQEPSDVPAVPGRPRLALAPQVFNARRFEIALDARPTIARIGAHLATLAAFHGAAPGLQPDTE
jgi:maleylpyruvate isomerase